MPIHIDFQLGSDFPTVILIHYKWSAHCEQEVNSLGKGKKTNTFGQVEQLGSLGA